MVSCKSVPSLYSLNSDLLIVNLSLSVQKKSSYDTFLRGQLLALTTLYLEDLKALSLNFENS